MVAAPLSATYTVESCASVSFGWLVAVTFSTALQSGYGREIAGVADPPVRSGRDALDREREEASADEAADQCHERGAEQRTEQVVVREVAR